MPDANRGNGHGATPWRPPVTESSSGLASVVERNIHALLARRQREEHQKRFQDRISDAVTRFTGSMTFVILHLILFSLWIGINMAPGVPKHWRFDPSLVILAMAASVEAIFLSTFVLISQNRMQAQADARAELELQVNLLAEHEVTRLITLVTAMAERMGIEAAQDPELSELAQDVAPERVLDEIESDKQKFGFEGTSAP